MSNPNISVGAGFHFDEVDPKTAVAADAQLQRILSINPSLAGLLATRTTLNRQNNVVSEPLGDLVGFVNPVDPTRGMNFAGRGFNMIFRPQSPKTPTDLPVKVPGSDNVLELNLTTETLSFSAPLGNVPNRGSGTQGDIFLNAVMPSLLRRAVRRTLYLVPCGISPIPFRARRYKTKLRVTGEQRFMMFTFFTPASTAHLSHGLF